MRYVKIEEVKSGDVPAHDIVSFLNGKPVVLYKATDINATRKLDDYIISKLKEKGIHGIYIEDELSKGLVIDDAIPQEIRNNAILALNDKKIDEVEKIAMQMVRSFKNNIELDFNRMMYDNLITEKAISICELAISIGKKRGYTTDVLNQLACASLLSEVGFMLTEEEKQNLNVEEKLKSILLHFPIEETYPLIGKLFLSKSHVNSLVVHSILFHQENVDGTGLIYNLYNKLGDKPAPKCEIRETATILHMCVDYMNALIDEKSLEKARNTISNGIIDRKYPLELGTLFLKNVPLYSIGSIVMLSNNEKALVVKNHEEFPLTPVVRLLTGEEVDLKNTPYVVVSNVADELQFYKKN